VRASLMASGIAPDCIIATRGLGKANPVATNETESGRQANRRVELVIQDVTPQTSLNRQ
jgi:outer membrane protein OmpA-like peptidoglycan-associated protein